MPAHQRSALWLQASTIHYKSSRQSHAAGQPPGGLIHVWYMECAGDPLLMGMLLDEGMRPTGAGTQPALMCAVQVPWPLLPSAGTGELSARSLESEGGGGGGRLSLGTPGVATPGGSSDCRVSGARSVAADVVPSRSGMASSACCSAEQGRPSSSITPVTASAPAPRRPPWSPRKPPGTWAWGGCPPAPGQAWSLHLKQCRHATSNERHVAVLCRWSKGFVLMMSGEPRHLCPCRAEAEGFTSR